MAGGLLPQPKQLVQDNAWNPGIAYQLYTYEPASLTPKGTFQDNALAIANTNPVVANARGEVVMYGTGSYRVILKDSLGNTIWDRDNIDALVGGASLLGATGASLVGYDDSTLDIFLKSRLARVVTSISALRALVKTKATQAFVTGYYASGDGGGGPYYYDAVDTTTADNGGTVIVAGDGGRWKLASSARPSVKQFGAKGDGTTDDTAAMQAAHNTGRVIYYPAGTFKFSAISMTAGGIEGDGESYTVLTCSDVGTANAITHSATNLQPGVNAPIFSHFTLRGDNAKTGGAGLFITAPTSENQGASLANLTIYLFPTCLQFGAASQWVIEYCKFINYKNAGVRIENTFNSDSGDSIITGCLFNTSVGTAPLGIDFRSSGGLKLSASKFNGGSYGVYLGLTAASSTSDLLISNCSIENQTVAAISLARASGTANFLHTVIVGNQIAICPNGISVDTSGAIADVTIQGNSISLGSGSGTAIYLGSVNVFNIGGNTLLGATGTQTGIAIAAGCTNGKIGKNTYFGLATSLANASVSTFIEGDIQSGTANITTSTAYGSLYNGYVDVTFPVPFTVTPVVHTFPGVSGGAISATASSITKTGFRMSVFGVTNGGAANACPWIASGVV